MSSGIETEAEELGRDTSGSTYGRRSPVDTGSSAGGLDTSGRSSCWPYSRMTSRSWTLKLDKEDTQIKLFK